MKRNTLLIPFVAVLTLLVVSMVSAQLVDESNITTKFNDVILAGDHSDTMTATSGEMVPVKITFTAEESASDVRVKVYMEGHRDDVSVKTNRFDIEAGKTYTKLLSLTLPSDSDDSSEDYTLYVKVYTTDDNLEVEYPISIQKKSYTFEVKSVDYTSEVSAGDVFPVSVVVKNTAYNRMDDTYVVVSIPALGVSARGYAGDLVVTSEDNNNEDKEDSVYQTVYLKVPENAASGVYEMQIEAYNDDASTVVKQLVSVEGEASEEVVATENQDVNGTVSSSVVALTVILVIVFVVLLAVLVILLTKKEKPMEEVETSYY